MRRIAIDGPAASGKSAVGGSVAAQLGIPFVDTGLMYRALTWLVLQTGVSPENALALANLAANVRIDIAAAPDGVPNQYSVWIDGLDATPRLRDPDVERCVSLVSAVPAVREHLVQLQRQLAATSVVMAGRDIGSVVLPDAELKIYLDASPEERARRRQKELLARGQPADYEALLEQMRRRDYLDSTRKVAPLRPAADAIRLVTDGLSLNDVVRRVLDLANEAAGRGSPHPTPGGSTDAQQ